MYSLKDDTKIQVSTSVIIDASPEKVWSVLADIENWKKWTSFVASFVGDFSKGGRIKVVFNTPDGQVPFDRTLVIFEENRVFCWEGDAMWPGAKDHHVFHLEAIENEKTLFTHADGFHGIKRTEQMTEAEKQMEGLYILMNQDLKNYVGNMIK